MASVKPMSANRSRMATPLRPRDGQDRRPHQGRFHEIIRFDEPDWIFAQGGALEAYLDGRRVGKLRLIGFTEHKDSYVHRGFDKNGGTGGRGARNRHSWHEEHGNRLLLKSNTAAPNEYIDYVLNLTTAVGITSIDSMTFSTGI
jgi:hypothetical protein